MFAETEKDVVLGSPEEDAKAIVQNAGLRTDIFGANPFLQRRLHLWFAIRPPAIDLADPWTDQPSFDPYTFLHCQLYSVLSRLRVGNIWGARIGETSRERSVISWPELVPAGGAYQI